MKKIREFFANLPEEITVTTLDGALIVAISVLAGALIGVLMSPRSVYRYKAGHVYCGLEDELEDEEAKR